MMDNHMNPAPQAICLEDLDAPRDDERYLRCVALPGDEPGLALDQGGVVRWMPDGPEAYELWVSGDGRLVLYRNPGAPLMVVRRGGRSLEAPAEKPVLLLDQDLLEVAGRRLRVHAHGEAEEVHEPEFLSARSLARMARAAAAALALSTAVGAAGEARGAPSPAGVQPEPIEVRLHPPRKAPPRKKVRCDIVSFKKGKKHNLLTLKCPKGTQLYAGLRGNVLDGKTGKSRGIAVVTKVNKTTAVARTKLEKLDGAKKVFFLVRKY